ncbi:MAG TPA: hypothetical protein VNS63_23095 [Blastocatellia bacterium]|nr:hypothetical protein [Blastocatellia bacterium]
MATRIKTKAIPSINRISTSGKDLVDPDDLKIVVRDGFASMTTADREAFILDLEWELRTANLSVRAFLIPLGISARSLEELTPSDVGHLVRFLKINVPAAMRAVDGVIEQFAARAEGSAKPGDRLVA